MKNLILLISVIFPLYVMSQELHSPAEMLKIMEQSSLTYSLEILKAPIPQPDLSEKIISNEFFRVETDSGIIVYGYKPNLAAKEFFDQAEENFSNKNFSSAEYYYKKALEADSTYYLCYTYLGQMAENAKRTDEAIELFRTAIKINYIDYMAHWFLADNLLEKGLKKEALREITIAHILNRNNPRLIASMDMIWKKNKLTYENWYFVPQCRVSKTDSTHISLQFDENWLGYGVPKAIWAYEPGYREKMGQTENQFCMLEEKECLLNLEMIISKDKKKLRFPEFKALDKAFEQKMVDNYIIYEIFLPKEPFIASNLPVSFIEGIADYLINVRNK